MLEEGSGKKPAVVSSTSITHPEQKKIDKWEVNQGKTLASLILNVAPKIQYSAKETETTNQSGTNVVQIK